MELLGFICLRQMESPTIKSASNLISCEAKCNQLIIDMTWYVGKGIVLTTMLLTRVVEVFPSRELSQS